MFAIRHFVSTIQPHTYGMIPSVCRFPIMGTCINSLYSRLSAAFDGGDVILCNAGISAPAPFARIAPMGGFYAGAEARLAQGLGWLRGLGGTDESPDTWVHQSQWRWKP